MLLVEQAETAPEVLEPSERIHALECALNALDHRARGIPEVRVEDVPEANREQCNEWIGNPQVLQSPSPASMRIPNAQRTF
jgi:hypothetical protein